MNILKTFISLLILSPALSFGQIAVSESFLDEVVMLTEDGQSVEALAMIDSLRKIITVKDENYYNLIITSAELNLREFNYEAAIRDNEELIKLAPGSELSYLAQIAFYKKFLGDFEGEITVFKRILELDQIRRSNYKSLAAAYISAGKYQQAINTLDSIPTKERLPQEYFHYAVAFYKSNRPDSAKLNIDRYLQTEVANTDFHGYRYAAQIYSTLGDKNKSCEFISKANQIISKTDPAEQISKSSKKVQEFPAFKILLKEIDETKKLKRELCEN